ncbi:MAG: FtsX-like permease family protein, partial [Longimicrobiales bacterium]
GELSDGELSPEVMERAGWRATVETLRDRTVGDVRAALWIVLGTVGFLLLVACASVANLFLVRAESRQRESGLRLALGASRSRLAATFLTESLLLGLAGGALGMLLATVAVRALVAAAPAELPRLDEIGVDATVLLFAFVLSVVAGVLFGLIPLPQQLRSPLNHLVRDGRGSAGRDRQRVRKTLIVAQIALALMLLTGSTLMVRSFQRMRAVDPGVRADGVLTLGISMGDQVERTQATQRYQRITAEVAALPGVGAVGLVNALPLDPDGLNGSSFDIESKPRADDALPPVSMYSATTPGYFEAMGTAVVRGRTMERADIDQVRDVVWVSETFARDFLDGDALGERVRFNSEDDWLEVVGVVRDVYTFGVREEMRPMAYMPMNQLVGTMQVASMTLVIRTTGDPGALAPSVRAAVQRIEPNVPIMTARTMRAVVDASMADTAFTTTILMVAAIVALLLGAIGLYGVIGYVVSQRTQEIGVRIALGARPAEVRTMVLRQGLGLAIGGVLLGLVGAFALTRVLESLLYEVDRLDPLTFMIVPVVLLGVSALAAWIPARRAAGVSPLQALRAE